MDRIFENVQKWKIAVGLAESEASQSIWETDKGWYDDLNPSKPYSDCERVSSDVQKDKDECKAQQLLYLGRFPN